MHQKLSIGSSQLTSLSLPPIFRKTMSTVAFHTLGCKLNFAETSTIARDFSSKGFEKVGFTEPADVYVINTCSVTENADRECKTHVRSALKQNPDAFVVVVGCYAQLKPGEVSNIEGVDLVLGATEKFKITDYLNDLTKNDLGEVHSCEIDEADFFVGSYSMGDRTRAILKSAGWLRLQMHLLYHSIGHVEFRAAISLENVLNNAREIAAQGIKEIVLTGVNVGDYGRGEFGNKKHEHTFLDLVKALDEVDGIHRLRISSIEPNLLKDETIQFVAQSKRFVPHFHIPLQSGSNKILGLMKRRYNRELYVDRVHSIKQPHATCLHWRGCDCWFSGRDRTRFHGDL
jgi:threonylcarbamoyladenosine tRNA methylthiotransferase MtaB